MPQGVAAGGRKAAVMVEQLRRRIDFLTTGSHPIGEAEDAVAKMEALSGGLHQRLVG